MEPRNTLHDPERRNPKDSALFRLFRGFFPGCVAVALCPFVAIFAGCRSAQAPKPAAPPNAAASPKPLIAWAEVASVNAAQGYVVLHAKGLISTGGEATVWRGTNEVARLRVGGPARPAWLTADILSGHPQPGDRVEIKIMKNKSTGSGGK